MSKEAYYFSHDSNARNDEKILALRMKHGMEGYGIFWAILERMRENSDYTCIKDYNVIAFDLRVSAEKIKSVVEDFGLFTFSKNDKKFFSESFLSRMKNKDEKSEKARKAAEARWGKGSNKSESNTDAMQTHSGSNPNGMPYKGKEKKGKEIKEKEKKNAGAKNSPPSLAYDLLKNEKQSELEAFMMQKKKQVEKWDRLITAYNNKIDLQISRGELDFEAQQLMPRFRSFVEAWIDNQKKYASTTSDDVQRQTSNIPIG